MKGKEKELKEKIEYIFSRIESFPEEVRQNIYRMNMDRLEDEEIVKYLEDKCGVIGESLDIGNQD